MANISTVQDAWHVPSTSKPGLYYDVMLYTSGETSCTCPWGMKENAPSLCWHARFAILMRSEAARESTGQLTQRRALDGKMADQIQIYQAVAASMVLRGAFQAASTMYSDLSKYIAALSVQGFKPADEQAQAADPLTDLVVDWLAGQKVAA